MYYWTLLVLTMTTLKSMKTIYILTLTAALVACGMAAKDADTTVGQDAVSNTGMDDLTEETGNEGIFEGGKICASEDGRVTIESGIYPDGGTSPDYWAKWTIVNEQGEKLVLRLAYTSFMSKVHSLQKSDGTAYYLVNCFGKASSVDGYEWLEAYKIVGDTIKKVNVIDGSDHVGNDDFSVNYEISHWYYTTNGAGYDWMFEYDTKTRRLYVPTTNEQVVLDRYQVWEFNGERFVCLGERPHKGLHESLEKYNCLICYFSTEDYIVRVDSLDSRELRYASWRKPKTMADTPDIVLTGGQRRKYTAAPDELRRCDDFRFANESYEYVVNFCETKLLGEGYGEHHDYLLVTKDGKMLVKQERMSEE